MKFAYPAILEPEDGGYNVSFPDVKGCYTCGDDMADALYMAQDALASFLAYKEEHGEEIPKASAIGNVQVSGDVIKTMIMADTDQFRRLNNKKAVKKTLTIPGWLNEAAEARSINFSQVLQDALRAQIGI